MRKMLPKDADDMYEYAQDPAVTQFLLWEPHVNVKFTQSYLKFIQTQYASASFFDWAVTLPESGKMIGTCGFAKIDTVNNSAELGYVLNPAYHHRGYATEAARAMLEFGFGELGLHRIEARFMEGNEPSRLLMERLGMKPEGFERDSVYVKGSYRTVGKYAILSSDFFGNKE